MGAASKNRYAVDAANELRSEDAAAITSDTDFAVQKLKSNGHYWAQDAVRDGQLAVVLGISALTLDGETIDIEIYTASDESKSNPQLQSSTPVRANGQLVIPVDQFAMAQQDADATHWFVRVNVTIASAGTPTVKIAAWINPAGHA